MKSFNIGSKRKNAKQIEIKVTPMKVFLFFLGLITFASLATYVIFDDIVEIIPNETSLKCSSGSIELVEYGKEFYCGQYYLTISDDYIRNKVKSIVEGVENG